MQVFKKLVTVSDNYLAKFVKLWILPMIYIYSKKELPGESRGVKNIPRDSPFPGEEKKTGECPPLAMTQLADPDNAACPRQG